MTPLVDQYTTHSWSAFASFEAVWGAWVPSQLDFLAQSRLVGFILHPRETKGNYRQVAVVERDAGVYTSYNG